jgi:hypothetical protein
MDDQRMAMLSAQRSLLVQPSPRSVLSGPPDLRDEESEMGID